MSYPYENQLWAIVSRIDDSILPTERARLAAWEADARARGVAEANIIAVLRSWNIWDQATADLSSVTIPNELKRVQSGGADGDISKFQPTAPPSLPDIGGMLSAQGGALTGASQYTKPISPIASPPVTINEAVAANPTTTLTTLQAGLTAPNGNPTVNNAPGISGPLGPSPTQSALTAPTSVPTGGPLLASVPGAPGVMASPGGSASVGTGSAFAGMSTTTKAALVLGVLVALYFATRRK